MYNRELQSIDTQEKAYLLGLFYADGNDYYKVKKQRYLCKTCKRHFTAPLSSNIQSGGDELLEG